MFRIGGMKFWPLAVPSFTTLDKLKVGYWLLKENHWSQGDWVRAYEKTWEDYTKAQHAIMVSSGSAANLLIAQRRKWELERQELWPKCNKVVFPVVNWVSAVSPWVMLGFEPVFVDVSSNLCSSGDQVAKALEEKNLAAVFYTTLLGVVDDLHRIKALCCAAGVPLYLDNCESSFSRVGKGWGQPHVCGFATSSTSFYFSHHTSGNQEGGMIFTNNREEAEFFRMARNHGMTRGMPDRYKNPDAHPWFDFWMLGSNHRSTNLLAYMASLDFKRALGFSNEREKLSGIFSAALDSKHYEKPHLRLGGGCPLALPIVAREWGRIAKVRKLLDFHGIEHRPIVGGNLLRHTAFRKYGVASKFPRAQHIHDNGLYIGLHTGVTRDMVRRLAGSLNQL